MLKKFSTLGCCGLDCGLCPRYYTEGSSKCPGCCGDGFSQKHPSCSVITCCVKKRNLEVCAECIEFPCKKYDNETVEKDSFITHKKLLSNQRFINNCGLTEFIEQQNRRITILEELLKLYDDGSCKSYYCLAAALLSLDGLNKVLNVASGNIRDKSILDEDIKNRAKIMKEAISRLACEENIELKLKK